MSQHTEQAAALAGKAAPLPSIAVAGAYFGGMSLPDWAALLAIIYTLCLIVQQLYRLCCWANERLDRFRVDE